ncbi:metallophosphoesterase family protein [Bacteroides sp. 224]|uniref:metallophosphoesterase family protein n=1 Tax=Bacteroides sp. 224 TaxID=2302936 RepID=UPI0013D5AC3A|nr:metallophosphoesterase family protein [Bacteroides sp. 224]NDV66793.1 metallophosphatase [Bacteroides sp. 224]
MNTFFLSRSLFLYVLFSCLACAFKLHAQSPALSFNKQGKFKIVQFTDIHFKYGNPASDIALVRINEVLEAERPDLIVITGDVVYAKPANEAFRQVLSTISKHKIPFVTTFGNHDDEFDLTRSQLYDLAREYPYCMMPDRGESSSPDYVLEVKASTGGSKAALLYCMESNTYSKVKGIKGYGWFSLDQVMWYKKQSERYTLENNGTPFPALAFFHIPLPEYATAVENQNAILRGTRMEKVCAPEMNSGMFATMREAGDVMGIFVGHDHDNDYAVMWKDILLAYGRYTGGNTEYNHLPNGARVIELKEGERNFTTWIRQKEGEVMDKYTYPVDFYKK